MHSTVIAAGFPFTSEDELGHHSLSSQRQRSPRGVLSPCLFTDWLVYPSPVKFNIECKLDRRLWYADDSGAGASYDDLEKYFELLKVYDPSYGYTPQPHKCILVTSDRNLSSAKSKFERNGMKVVTGSRYLGGFIGSPTLRSNWLREKASFWEKSVKTMARASK